VRRGPRLRPSTLGLLAVGVALVLGTRIRGLAQRPPPATVRPSTFVTRVWDWADTPAGPMRAVVMLPRSVAPGERLPLLVALHGWGEAVRGVERGAWGWARDYELDPSDAALRRPRLSRDAFLGWVSPGRFAALRRDHAARPYQGVVVVAPYTPDYLEPAAAARVPAYADWIAQVLVPRARRELPVLGDRAATGIDGVSLGGLVALETGFLRPETFGVVGALQAAVLGRTEQVLARRQEGPARPAQRLRLVTSRGDPLRAANEALHAALTARGVAHDWRVVEGPHDYVFNRGAGGVEMLRFHDRALRGEAAE